MAAIEHTGQLVLRGDIGGGVAPAIFNAVDHSQYTSEAFTGVLPTHEVRISMDDKGRVLGNVFVEQLWRSVKYEDVYLKGYATMQEVKAGLKEYFRFYDQERFRQVVDNRTPTRYSLFKEQRNTLHDPSKNDRPLVCQTGLSS